MSCDGAYGAHHGWRQPQGLGDVQMQNKVVDSVLKNYQSKSSVFT